MKYLRNYKETIRKLGYLLEEENVTIKNPNS